MRNGTLHRGVGLGGVVLGAVFGWACDSEKKDFLSPEPAPAVSEVTIEPLSAPMTVGSTYQLDMKAKDANGNPIKGRPVTWESSDETVATVDAKGLVTALAAGSTTVSATCEGKVGTVLIEVKDEVLPVATVEVTPASADLATGETQQFTAVLKAQNGTTLSRPVDWATTDALVATVDANGLATAVAAGQATISATSEGKTGTAQVTVRVPVASVVIDDPGHEPVEVGLTKQLSAKAYDGVGNVLDRVIVWASADESLATVDQTGLVTGVGRGVVDISATCEGASDAVSIRVVGESGLGNNLSWPVVFSEGVGLTGELVSVDPGVRPSADEGIVVDALPFFWSGNVADYGIYYTQQSANTWQAEWADGTALGLRSAEAAWGDNITKHTWNTHSVIRIEIGLTDRTIGTLDGYNMTYLYGQGPDEMQGTDGSTGAFVPTIYSIVPRLVIEKLDDATMQPIETVFDGAIWEGGGGDGPNTFGAEVNVGGKIIYGFTFFIRDITLTTANVHKYGWWRLTYRFDDSAQVGTTTVPRNVSLDAVVGVGDGTLQYAPTFDPQTQTTVLDIYVEHGGGGGGGGGGNH